MGCRYCQPYCSTNTIILSINLPYTPAVHLRKFGADQLRIDYHYRAWNSQGGRLEWTSSGTSSGSTVNATLQNFTYSYDPNGNVVSIVDALAGGAQTQSFGYDALDRLISAIVTGGNGGLYS